MICSIQCSLSQSTSRFTSTTWQCDSKIHIKMQRMQNSPNDSEGEEQSWKVCLTWLQATVIKILWYEQSPEIDPYIRGQQTGVKAIQWTKQFVQQVVLDNLGIYI